MTAKKPLCVAMFVVLLALLAGCKAAAGPAGTLTESAPVEALGAELAAPPAEEPADITVWYVEGEAFFLRESER